MTSKKSQQGLNQIEVLFRQWKCYVQIRYYDNDRIAIVLIDATDKDTVAVATINVPKYPLKDGEVIIKNYSENEGMLQCLIKAGVISAPVAYVQTGFVTCPVCKLLVQVQQFNLSLN